MTGLRVAEAAADAAAGREVVWAPRSTQRSGCCARLVDEAQAKR